MRENTKTCFEAILKEVEELEEKRKPKKRDGPLRLEAQVWAGGNFARLSMAALCRGAADRCQQQKAPDENGKLIIAS